MATTFLDIVGMELAEMANAHTELSQPLGELREGDNEVGVVDDDSKRLYALAQRYRRKSEEAAVAARYATTKGEMEELAERAMMLQSKASTILDVFWISLKDAHDLWEKPCVGIRVGWRVVWSENQTASIDEIIGHILSRMGK